MLQIILWTDGRMYSGRSAEEIIDAMRADSIWTAAKSRREYMRGVARRLRAVDGAKLNHADATAFLAGLEVAGYIRQELMQ